MFIGRNNEEVNINGKRLNLVSIETALIQLPEIKQALVVPEHLEKKTVLNAFLILNTSIPHEKIISHLKEACPTHAIPHFFYIVNQFALSPNGKVVRDKSEQNVIGIISQEYLAPRNKIERQIVSIWEKLLNCKPISINDDFELLGGDSLLYEVMVGELEKFFLFPLQCHRTKTTVKNLARVIEKNSVIKHQNLAQLSKEATL